MDLQRVFLRPGGTSLGGGLVATRSQPKLLAQGKPRTLGGSSATRTSRTASWCRRR
jgi:hypothetical protein